MKYSDEQRIRKIYENACKLMDYLATHEITKAAHREIEWFMIAGLRHRLVHDYDGTNWNIIAEVVFEELPVLVKQIEEMML